MTNKKIEVEVKKIGILNLRIDRLLNLSQNKISDIQEEFNRKVNKVYTLIELSQEKIRDLRVQSLEDKQTPEEIDYDIGIDWIHGDTTETVPINFKKIEDAKEYINDEEMDIGFLG